MLNWKSIYSLVALALPIMSIPIFGQDVVSDVTLKNQKEASKTHLNIHFGHNFSTIQFFDSEGVKMTDITYLKGNSYLAGMEFNIKKKHLFQLECMYYDAGAESNFQNNLNWKLNYLGAGFSYGLKLINNPRYTLVSGLSLGADYLTKAYQSFGAVRYDLKASNAFENLHYRGILFLSNRIQVSEYMQFCIDYRFFGSLTEIEKDDTDQISRNIGHHILIGFNIQL
jgi:hypothetical protein